MSDEDTPKLDSDFLKKATKDFMRELGYLKVRDYLIVPYNHWKRDTEWLLLISRSGSYPMYIHVEAVKLDEAIVQAIEKAEQYAQEMKKLYGG